MCAADLYGRVNQLVELLEVSRSCVGNGAEFHFALTPINPLEALPGSFARWGVTFSSGPDKYIDWTAVMLIDEYRDHAAFNNIQAPAV